jgi:peptidoglycan/xylan/chitin deacetylase (PgdA/CDA1 family)
MDKKQVKRIADTEVKKGVKGHEKAMHGMKHGGPTSSSMKAVGRNMARANNQRGR